MKQFIAGLNENDVRLSRFVLSVTTNMPNSLLHKCFRNKRIKVNGKKATADTRLKQGDSIELYINDEFFVEKQVKTKKTDAVKYPPLKVIFEDDNLLIVYKPFHMLCHEDKTGDICLLSIIINYLKEKGDYVEENENTFKPSICNRLDRGTEGLVIAAKNYASLRDMNRIIKNNLIQKHYKCITVGLPKIGIHTAYLKHSEKNNKVQIQNSFHPDFKQILTGVEIIERKHAFALCNIHLITGRTHQIRAHLSFLNAPILGDIKYGNRNINKQYKTKTQVLCAYKIIFSNIIPQENTLHYLKGKIIKLNKCSVDDLFVNL